MQNNFKQVLAAIEEGKLEMTATIGHVAYYLLEKTAYSFHFYAVYQNEKTEKDVLTEMLYDLRNKKYFIKRNGRELRFNVANLYTVIPRQTAGFRNVKFCSKEGIVQFFNMVSVEENKGMYKAMIKSVGAIGDEQIDMSSRTLIRLITDYNKLELLYKAGIDIQPMHNNSYRALVYAASRDDARKAHQIFKVSKSQLKFLREFIPDITTLVGCLYSARHLEQQDMDVYRGYMKHIEELAVKYDLDGRRAAFLNFGSNVVAYIKANHIRKTTDTNYDRDFFGFVAEFKFSNPHKLLEYLLFECYLSQGMEFNTALQEYRDYYSMCMDLDYERFDKYPKYLKTYHDIVARNFSSVKDKVAAKKFDEATAKYSYLEEEKIGDFSVVVPREALDVVNEGNVLQHCVGSYIKKVAEGKTRIVFLRLKESREDPLVTVEIRGDEIVQVRGQANRFPYGDEAEAIRKYAKKKDLKVKSVI